MGKFSTKQNRGRFRLAGWFILVVIFVLVIWLQRTSAPSTVLPEVSGHRGADAIAPENTLASLDSCIKYGVEWMECDVCISRDSVFYILHDWTLDRTTDGTGNISKRTSDYIDRLDAGSWFGEEWKGLHVPRFEEVLRKAREGGIGITVDYRSGDLHELLGLIRREGMLDRCCFTFSNEADAAEFRRIAPEIRTLQAYVKDAKDFERVMRELSPDIAVFQMDDLTADLVALCHGRGVKVLGLALGLGNKTKLNEKAIELGVDILATDRPEEFIKRYRR